MANFVYTLSKDDVNLATRCFQFAKFTHEKGHTVNIFFIEDGVKWADNTRDHKEKSTTGDCPADYFPYLVENEVPIGV
jgi:sulfur relay (sulfurtransferase) complex TusBCD TusD component (DsrE family)